MTRKGLEEKLSDALDLEIAEEKEVSKKEVRKELALDVSAEEDIDEARAVIKKMINIGADAVEDLRIIAKETEQARHFEVLNQTIKTTVDNAESLVKNHKIKQELQKGLSGGNEELQKALELGAAAGAGIAFHGTSAELLRQSRENKENIVTVESSEV